MAFTKSAEDVDAVAEVASGAVREGAASDISGCVDAVAFVDVAWGNGAATAAEVIVEVSSNASGDTDWSIWASIQTPAATIESEAVSGTENAGATVIEVASTTGLTVGELIFFLNSTVGNSEWGRIVSVSTNTSITLLDGITNAQTSSAIKDGAQRYTVPLPTAAMRCRVLVNNTSGLSMYTRTRVVKATP